MYGEDEDENELGEGSLNSISPFKRILVLAAGAFMNLVTAIIILMIVYLIAGTEPSTTVSTVLDNSPAYTAGLKNGDTIIKIENYDINSWEDISKAITSSNGKEINITYKQADNQIKETTITPYLDKASQFI